MMCGIDEAIRYIRENCQDAQADLMVAMVPAEDRYQYEIIKSGRAADRNG